MPLLTTVYHHTLKLCNLTIKLNHKTYKRYSINPNWTAIILQLTTKTEKKNLRKKGISPEYLTIHPKHGVRVYTPPAKEKKKHQTSDIENPRKPLKTPFKPQKKSHIMSLAAAKPATMFYRIQQLRSTIGMPPLVRKNIAALGLKRRNAVVYQKVSVATAHKLRMVKELVKIDLLHPQQAHALKKEEGKLYPSGFQKIGQL